jgi:hypothetical protein
MGQIIVKFFLKGNYENKPDCRARRNKANSKPIAGFWPEIRNKLIKRLHSWFLERKSGIKRMLHNRQGFSNDYDDICEIGR